MTLKEYFATNKGRGIIATADAEGNVNAAVYAIPHMMESGQIAFIMRDKLTHKNITENPKAAYLFEIVGDGVCGIRLYIEKIKEEQDSPKLEELRRRKHSSAEENEMSPKFLVYFKVNKILPLLGDGDPGVSVE
jgi:hypothetical protein